MKVPASCAGSGLCSSREKLALETPVTLFENVTRKFALAAQAGFASERSMQTIVGADLSITGTVLLAATQAPSHQLTAASLQCRCRRQRAI